MKVQNINLAGEKLTLRYHFDEDGGRIAVQGDSQGIFEVPDRDGQFLLTTPGWGEPVTRVARSLEEVSTASSPNVRLKPPLAPPMPTGALKAPTQPAPAEDDESAEEGEEGEGDKEGTEEGPDISAIKTKADALAIAKEYGVDLDEDMLLREMKEKLELELYGTDEDKKAAEDDDLDRDAQ